MPGNSEQYNQFYRDLDIINNEPKPTLFQHDAHVIAWLWHVKGWK